MRMPAQFVFRVLGRFGSLIAIGLLSTTFMLAAVAPQHAHAATPSDKLTVVLVHGGFADSSSWNDVVDRLLAKGYSVVAVANPLRGVQSDAKYVTALLDSIPVPVVLVGHSYGGIVITNVSLDGAKVKALVYVAALAPELGESASSLSDKFPGGSLGPTLAAAVALPEGGKDLYIQQSKFHAQFAADLPAAQAKLMAATQRPITEAALNEASSAPSWKSIPSWFPPAPEWLSSL